MEGVYVADFLILFVGQLVETEDCKVYEDSVEGAVVTVCRCWVRFEDCIIESLEKLNGGIGKVTLMNSS